MSTRIGMLAFTQRGWALSARLAEGLLVENSCLEIARAVKCEALGEASDSRPAKEIVAAWWDRDVLIFIGAAGIAVRLTAPRLEHKALDPAVLVLDEQGQFCISLLSGHLGRANAWTCRVANLLTAQAVITTATDVSHGFAADLFAAANNLALTDFTAAKKVSARSLQGLPIRIYSELPRHFLRQLPPENQLEYLTREKIHAADILIGIHTLDLEFATVCAALGKQSWTQKTAAKYDGIGLFLPLRCLWIGIGARKDVSEGAVANAVEHGLAALSLSNHAIAGLASIDLKKNETGILNYAKTHQLPFWTYGREELLALPGTYTESAFVRSVTGVDNVCERSAMKAAGPGARLLLRKQIYDGVTLAIACTECCRTDDAQQYVMNKAGG